MWRWGPAFLINDPDITYRTTRCTPAELFVSLQLGCLEIYWKYYRIINIRDNLIACQSFLYLIPLQACVSSRQSKYTAGGCYVGAVSAVSAVAGQGDKLSTRREEYELKRSSFHYPVGIQIILLTVLRLPVFEFIPALSLKLGTPAAKSLAAWLSCPLG